MTHTRPWDETAPLGSVAANTIDTIIQNLKSDIRERLVDLGSTNYAAADPIAFAFLRMIGAAPYVVGGNPNVIEFRLSDGLTVVAYIDNTGTLYVISAIASNLGSFNSVVVAGGLTVGTTASVTGNVGVGGTLTLAGLLTAGAAALSDNLVVTGGQAGSVLHNAGNSGAAIAVDWNNGNNQLITLTGNPSITFTNPNNFPYMLKLKQDATGSRIPTWPGNWKWAGGTTPTFTTTVNRSDVVCAVYDGTNYLANVFGYNFNG